MKIALVHDYLAQDGGAERVLHAFHEMWPDAPIFVLFHDINKIKNFPNADIRESFIAKLPLGKKKYQWYLPFMPLATEGHQLQDFDVVISSSSAFSKGILTKPETLHISYCHSPTRYLWTDTQEYIEGLKYNKLIKSLLPRLIHKLRLWDKASVDRVDHFIANSLTVKKRISKFYRRNSYVIYPPVDTQDFFISKNKKEYFVTGGRMVPYKRFDLIIKAFNKLGFPLKIYGDGPEMEKLKKHAKDNIVFLGRISDKEKANLLANAKAFIHPQEEDLGITPIESMASGRPVIAYGKAGVTETVIPGKTGVFFYNQTWEDLVDTILSFSESDWNSEEIRDHALKFSKDQFKKSILSFVKENYSNLQKNSSDFFSTEDV